MAQAHIERISKLSAIDLWSCEDLSIFDKLREYGRRIGARVEQVNVEIESCIEDPRCRDICPDKVADFMKGLEENPEETLSKFGLSSIIAYFSKNKYYVTDGCHRVNSMRKHNACSTSRISSVDMIVFFDVELTHVDILYTSSIAEQTCSKIKLQMTKEQVMRSVRVLVKNHRFKIPVAASLHKFTPEMVEQYRKIIGCQEASLSSWMIVLAAHKDVSDVDYELIISKTKHMGYERNTWSPFISNWKKYGNNCRAILNGINDTVNPSTKKTFSKIIKEYSTRDSEDVPRSEARNNYDGRRSTCIGEVSIGCPRHDSMVIMRVMYAALMEHNHPAIAALVQYMATKMSGCSYESLHDEHMLQYLDENQEFDFSKLPREDPGNTVREDDYALVEGGSEEGDLGSTLVEGGSEEGDLGSALVEGGSEERDLGSALVEDEQIERRGVEKAHDTNDSRIGSPGRGVSGEIAGTSETSEEDNDGDEEVEARDKNDSGIGSPGRGISAEIAGTYETSDEDDDDDAEVEALGERHRSRTVDFLGITFDAPGLQLSDDDDEVDAVRDRSSKKRKRDDTGDIISKKRRS